MYQIQQYFIYTTISRIFNEAQVQLQCESQTQVSVGSGSSTQISLGGPRRGQSLTRGAH